jgi:hypothetical protein
MPTPGHLSLLTSLATNMAKMNEYLRDDEYRAARKPLARLKKLTLKKLPKRLRKSIDEAHTKIQLISKELTSERDDKKITKARINFLRCVHEAIQLRGFVEGSTRYVPPTLLKTLTKTSEALINFAQAILMNIRGRTDEEYSTPLTVDHIRMRNFLGKSFSAASQEAWMDKFLGKELLGNWTNGVNALAQKLSRALHVPCVVKAPD